MKRRIVAAVLVSGLGTGAWIGLGHAANADEIARLRRCTPHGSHFIDTALTGGPVKWRAKEIAGWRIRRSNREFASVEDFKTAFRRRSPHPRASISVHHPALNLLKEEGRQSHERAQAILAFLARSGYHNAGPVSD